MSGETQCVSTPCPADLNDDGLVNGDDLGVLLTAWGACVGAECPADLTDDGLVNGEDLGALLTAWGACPP
ncbi:MAG: GC-type dockerin domain-anchored protein [Phycisphaerales bacterium]